MLDPGECVKGNGRLLRIERRLMSAEYYLDSTTAHVRNKKCEDIKPRARRRIELGLNALRGALAMVRIQQGARHPTLFAGTANPKSPSNDPTKGGRGQKQKSWGSSRAHGWSKDCEEVRK